MLIGPRKNNLAGEIRIGLPFLAKKASRQKKWMKIDVGISLANQV